MFFEKISELPEIAGRQSAAIFVVPKEVPVEIKNAICLKPEGKRVITIEQVRAVMQKLNTKQFADQFIVIRPAEAMNEEAANALLKSLEEPGERVHFVLITNNPSQILPTILSRAAVYIQRTAGLDAKIEASEVAKGYAKQLLVARGEDLVKLAEQITKKKDGARDFTLEVLGVAIEMLYKSYFMNGKEAFLRKIPKFLAAYEGVAQNGHLKLQIVANLI